MKPIDPPRPRSVGRLLGFLNRAATAVAERRLAPHDLSLRHWIVLSALWRREAMTLGELARYCDTHDAAMSRVIDRMAAKGLVERVADEDDRRAVRILLTARSRALREVATIDREIDDTLLRGFSRSERSTVLGMLERILQNCEEDARRDDA